MDKEKKESSRIDACRWMWQIRWELLLIVLLALVWRGVFFGVGVERIHLSGDEAIRALQAISISMPKDSPAVQMQQYPPGLLNHYPLLFMAQPYLFPLESYLSAPVINLFSRTPFAARLVPMLMGLVTVLLGIVLVNRIFIAAEKKNVRIGKISRYSTLLMVVFPSAYLLMLQSAYLLPSYQALMMFGFLALWLAEKNREVSWKNPLYAFCAGLSAGLASSNSLLAMPLMCAVAVMVCIGSNWRKAVTGSLGCVLGIGVGLLPFYLAKIMYPGAHAAVSTLVSFSIGLKRLWDPALTFTLPMALGIRSPLLPGWRSTEGVISAKFLSYFGYFWIVVIVAALGCCLYLFIRRLIRRRWPEVTIVDVAVGLSVAYPLLFVLSSRFSAWEFRYLLPVALFLPLIFAMLISISRGGWCLIVTGSAWLVVTVNVVTSLSLLAAWLDKKFDGGFTDTRPAIKWLMQEEINYCYSSYMDVYTINYFADGKIICSQPYNQRFPGWPYPYADVVDNADEAAFVLGTSRRFSRERLENDLLKEGIAYQQEAAGTAKIYYDFSAPVKLSAQRIDPDRIAVSVSHQPEDSDTLTNGVLTHQWRSHKAQHKGMWIELALPERIGIGQIKFYYNGYPHDHARSLNIYARQSDNTWKKVRSGVGWKLRPFDFVNNQPVYKNQVQIIEMEDIEADAIRIEIEEPNPGRDWTIGEIEVYEVD